MRSRHLLPEHYVVEYVTMTEPIEIVGIVLPQGCVPPYVLECTRAFEEPMRLYRTAVAWDEKTGCPIEVEWEELEAPSLAGDEHESEVVDEPQVVSAAPVLFPTLDLQLDLFAEEWRRKQNQLSARRGKRH